MPRYTAAQQALREYLENIQSEAFDTQDALNELGRVLSRYSRQDRISEGVALGLEEEIEKVREALSMVKAYSKLSLIKLDDILSRKE